MPKTIVNVTQCSVLQEIETILEQYPDHPYQQAFAHPDLQQELLVWVLNRVPSIFLAIEENDSAIVHLNDVPHSSGQQSSREYVIRQGIQEVLSQNQPENEPYNLEHPAEQPASHWFG